MAECTETGGGVAADAAARGEAGQTSVWTHVTTTQAETQKYGISIDGQKVSNLRYADGTALCGKYHEEICYLLDAINERGKEKKLKLNARGKKVMHIRKGLYQNVAIDGVILERVDGFIYLGSCKTSSGECKTKNTDALHKQNPR